MKAFEHFYHGWMHFDGKQKQPFTAIIKLGGDRTFFNITLIVFI